VAVFKTLVCSLTANMLDCVHLFQYWNKIGIRPHDVRYQTDKKLVKGWLCQKLAMSLSNWR